MTDRDQRAQDYLNMVHYRREDRKRELVDKIQTITMVVVVLAIAVVIAVYG